MRICHNLMVRKNRTGTILWELVTSLILARDTARMINYFINTLMDLNPIMINRVLYSIRKTYLSI